MARIETAVETTRAEVEAESETVISVELEEVQLNEHPGGGSSC